MLEEGGDTVAPPPRKKSATALLPDKPVLATLGRSRSSDLVSELHSASHSHSRAASVVTLRTAGTDDDADADGEHNEEQTSSDDDEEEDEDDDDEEEEDNEEDLSEVQDGVEEDNDNEKQDTEAEDKDKDKLADDEDVDMRLRSPSPELRGSSRTEGGLFRGRAAGLAPNMADMETGDADAVNDELAPLMGCVHLFTSRDPAAIPYLTMMHRVTPNLEPVLTELGINYSPVKSMS